MASIYAKNNILYASWWDNSENRTKNRSLKLRDTVANRKTAREFTKTLQKELDKQKELIELNGLVKKSTIKEAFEHFKRNNEHKNFHTIKDYDRFYKKFIESFDENRSCSIITKISAEEWINTIKKLSLAQNSIHGYYKQFSHFLNFLFEYSYIPMFKINKDVKTKQEIKEKIIFTDEDITTMFNNLESKNANFKTAVYLLFYTGLRSSDILTITVDRANLKDRIINYYSPKRKKFRQVPIHKDLVPVLKKRVKEISSGKLLDYKSVENLGKAVKRFLTKLGLTNRSYSARTFRKTFITLCRSRYSMDATIVRELVGHEHGNTTDRYYNQVDMNKMKEELNKFTRPNIEKK